MKCAPCWYTSTAAVVVEHLDTAAQQSIALRGEIGYLWRDIGAAREPGFDGVLIGRHHIDQMRGHQRMGVIRDELGSAAD